MRAERNGGRGQVTLPEPEPHHHHQGHHQRGGEGHLLQPKAGLKSGGKPPPPPPLVAMAPLWADGEGPFCKVTARSLS